MLYDLIDEVSSKVKYIAWLIKENNAQSDQRVIEYEDLLNKYSTIDYNKIGELV